MRGEDGKGQDALAGERLGTGLVGVDEVGIVQGVRNVVDNAGMDIVSPNLFFTLFFNDLSYDYI